MGKKKAGKGGAGYDDFWDDDAPAEVKPDELPGGGATKADIEDEDDDLAGGGGAASANKKKKDKKKKQQANKKQQQQQADSDEDEDAKPTAAAPVPSAAPAPSPPQPAAEQPPPAIDDDDDGDDDGAAGGGGAADKKKKKKKKKAGDKAEPAPAASAAKKAPNAAVAALQARLAAQKAAEEEAKRKEEEERKRIEEIERAEREAEEKKEAERLRKKEKEKAKREQLKKEGKLLTPKQKAEKAAAEARLQAMLRAGQIKVEGLEQRGEGEGSAATDATAAPAKKKVVYDSKKKKKGPTQQQSKEEATSPAVNPPAKAATEDTADADLKADAAIAPTASPEATEDNAADAASESDEDVKEDWDASSQEDEAGDVKDDWDAESGEEDGEQKKKVTTGANGTNKAASQSKAKAAGSAQEGSTAAKANGARKANGKQPAPESDDDDDDDSDDDDSDDDSEDDSDDSDDQLTSTQKMAEKRKAEAAARRKERTEQALAARNKDDLRSPICCILGHVDTGKTKLLDKIRQTNVQEGEAGGITQQIGATYFPVDVIQKKIAPVNKDGSFEIKVPGLLVIDTPGHESFTNLRTRGSSLCNIAILVVDIMHGLEQQTIESIRLLRDKKTPFIVALNKVDRLYGWKPIPDNGFQDSLAQQPKPTQNEFHERAQKVMVAFAEQGLNAKLYYDNKNFSKYVSLVPTSAHTGEGIPDMLQLLVNLTQTRMSERLMYLSELECTVLEVKVIEGLGTTIDVVLSNGVLREGDKIVICGLNDAIVTHVRALLTPQPLKEMRVKGAYVHHKEVKAALGVKIVAPDLEKAVSGSRLLLCGEDDDEEQLRKDVMSDLTNLLDSVDKLGKGVSVQASTLGSLEALLEFLRVSKIPVNAVNIGPVYKKDVVRCSTMLEKAPEFACMLCFDVAVDKEAEALAESLGIKVFKANIIYHLFDAFTAYSKEVKEAKAKDAASVAVWPCSLKILKPFATRDPIILGCDINEGSLRIGTPLCVVKVDPTTKKRNVVSLGKVTSLEINHKPKDVVYKKDVGAGVAVRIEHAVYENAKTYGRHFDDSDELISMISRNSIDALKENFWDEISNDEKRLMKRFKALLDIP